MLIEPTFLEDNLIILEMYLFTGKVGKMFANDPRDLCSIPGRVIPKRL